jgi:hypothetical protein
MSQQGYRSLIAFVREQYHQLAGDEFVQPSAAAYGESEDTPAAAAKM